MEDEIFIEAIALLKRLIATPSVSGEEDRTADKIEDYLIKAQLSPKRKGNNVWVQNINFDYTLPTVLLSAHHDTASPVHDITVDPYNPFEEDGKIYGLGSNNAGGSLVAMLVTFLRLNEEERLPFNMIFCATAEGETSGVNGLESILPSLGRIDLGIVGKPTGMRMAVAEKGLLVLDCVARGKAAHAARGDGVNAILKAMKDIDWLSNYQFPQISPLLGDVRMSVTRIKGGKKFNVVPDYCEFVVDIRTTDKYSNEEVLELVSQNLTSEIRPRSSRFNSSKISLDHPIVKRGIECGLEYYGSPIRSDQGIMLFPSIKLGPGEPSRLHSEDEFIGIDEIKKGIDIYTELLSGVKLS